MARTSIIVQSAPGSYATALSTLGWTAAATATGANGNQFSLTGAELVLVHNKHATATFAVNLTSVQDPYKRAGNLAASLPPGAYRMLGPVKITGWQQTDGKFYLDATSSQVEFAIIKIPGF